MPPSSTYGDLPQMEATIHASRVKPPRCGSEQKPPGFGVQLHCADDGRAVINLPGATWASEADRDGAKHLIDRLTGPSFFLPIGDVSMKCPGIVLAVVFGLAGHATAEKRFSMSLEKAKVGELPSGWAAAMTGKGPVAHRADRSAGQPHPVLPQRLAVS